MIELPRNRGQKAQAAAMWCDLSSKIWRRSSWVSSHQASDFGSGSAPHRWPPAGRARPAPPRAAASRRARHSASCSHADQAPRLREGTSGTRRPRCRDRQRRPEAGARPSPATSEVTRHPRLAARKVLNMAPMEAWNRAGFKRLSPSSGARRENPKKNRFDAAHAPE